MSVPAGTTRERLDAHQPEQEVVAARVLAERAGHALLDDEAAPEPFLHRRCQRDAAMVALRRAAGDQRVGALRQRVGDEELELARLVAARKQAELIVALDPDVRPAAVRALAASAGEARQQLERRRGIRIAAPRKTGQIHSINPERKVECQVATHDPLRRPDANDTPPQNGEGASSSFTHSSSVSVWTPSSAALRALEPAFSPTTTRLVFFDTESVTLAPSSSARALAASRVIVESSPVKTTILSLSGASAAIDAALHRLDGELLAQVADDLDVVALAEEGAHRVGGGDADLLDIAQPAVALADLGRGLLLLHVVGLLLALLGGLQHLGQPVVGVAVFLRQDLGRRLADQRDADGVDEAVERDGLARLDGRRSRLRTERSPQPSRFLISSILLGQAEDVARHLRAARR